MIKSAKKTGFVAVIEDHCVKGGLGSIISDILSDNNVKVLKFAYPDTPITHGTVAELDACYSLDAQSIADKIMQMKG